MDSAFVIKDIAWTFVVYFWTLHKAANVETDKIYPVWQALWYYEQRGEREFVICKGKLTFLIDLDNSGSVDSLLEQVMALYYELDSIGS